jgi:hypothetical protein
MLLRNFVFSPEQASEKWKTGVPLPKVCNLWTLNTLLVVPVDSVATGRFDPNTCLPVVVERNLIVACSMEMRSSLMAQPVYEDASSDPRHIRLEGGYWGKSKTLPSQLFNGGTKTVFFAYGGDASFPIWTEFVGDVQSLAQSSLFPNVQQSLPLAIGGEAHFRPVDLSAKLLSLAHQSPLVSKKDNVR